MVAALIAAALVPLLWGCSEPRRSGPGQAVRPAVGPASLIDDCRAPDHRSFFKRVCTQLAARSCDEVVLRAPDLAVLDLAGAEVSSLEPLRHFPGLKYLDLHGNRVHDHAPVLALADLEILYADAGAPFYCTTAAVQRPALATLCATRYDFVAAPFRRLKAFQPFAVGKHRIDQEAIAGYLQKHDLGYEMVGNSWFPSGLVGGGSSRVGYLVRHPQSGVVSVLTFAYLEPERLEKPPVFVLEAREDLEESAGVDYVEEHYGPFEIVPYLRGYQLADWVRNNRLFNGSAKSRYVRKRLKRFILRLIRSRVQYLDMTDANLIYDEFEERFVPLRWRSPRQVCQPVRGLSVLQGILYRPRCCEPASLADPPSVVGRGGGHKHSRLHRRGGAGA